MQNWKLIKTYFLFSKNEKRGVVVLSMLIFVVLMIRILLPYVYSNGKEDSIEISYIQIEAPEDTKGETSFKGKREIQEIKSNTEIRIEPRNYDPNTSSYKDLLAVGFERKVVNTLIKYRDAGGTFRRPTDLYKIYGIDSSHNHLIKSYCSIDTNLFRPTTLKTGKFKETLAVELNRADSIRLVKLPGVGEVLSQRIIRYRNMLGGFATKEQLREVYGIRDEAYNKFKAYISIDSSLVTQLNLNKVSEKELSKHPYLNNYQSRAIIKYRELIGDFNNPEEILTNYILTKEEFIRLKPYLTVN